MADVTIVEISKEHRAAKVELGTDELVALCNGLYQITKESDVGEIYLRLYSDLMLARDLSQYGHIDSFCLSKIVGCRERIHENLG